MTPAARSRKRLVHRRRPPQWHLLLSGGLLVTAIAIGVYLSERTDSSVDILSANTAPTPRSDALTATQFAQRLQADSDSLLGELGIGKQLIDTDPNASPTHIRVGIPRDLPIASVNVQLTMAIQRLGGHVIEGRESRNGTVTLRCGFDSTETTVYTLRRLRSTTRRTGNIGLVVRNVLLPPSGSKGLWDVSQQLTLMFDSTAAVGVTTVDWERLSQWAQGPAHQLLSPRSVADGDASVWLAMTQIDASEGVEIQGKDQPLSVLHLDDVQRPAAIERQLWALADRAADEGQAIGILQDHPSSHMALRSVLPRLERRGYRFVAVATLLP
jgi:hypothetical protein